MAGPPKLGDGVQMSSYDVTVERHADRTKSVGTGKNGNAIYCFPYDKLPAEAQAVIKSLQTTGDSQVRSGDGRTFGNYFGDLPASAYKEYTVLTPGVAGAGMRRIVKEDGKDTYYFTACHYDRSMEGQTSTTKKGKTISRNVTSAAANAITDATHRNGFYFVSGVPGKA